MKNYSETLSVLGRFLFLLVIVVIVIPNTTAKYVLLAVFLGTAGLLAYLLYVNRKKAPEPPQKKSFSPEEVNRLLESCEKDDTPPNPRLEKLVRSKSKSDLFRHGKVVFDDYTFFDITACRTKNYQGKRYYRISAEENASEEEYFIKEDPEDCAVYLFSLNPDIRAFTEEVETNPADDTFHPWKEYDSLDDFIGSQLEAPIRESEAKDKRK